ncbi:hypothetical protein FG386_000860 [Cryptosporidium ryanae]|uniref:uncharacterized protein n=1 Tax=Cryptosporidium ryanae TaxID=515981 RepID=UPI003519E4B8|nr:hypothetical protein FG386_000860 [Cryptosporidium ryanae]
MSKKILVAVANGFEEIEFISPVDILRRAGLDVVIGVSGDSLEVVGTNGVSIKGDIFISQLSAEFDAIICPGGMNCANTLGTDKHLLKLLKDTKEKGKLIAAICASPVLVFEKNGLLNNIEKATCYPSMASELSKPDLSNDVCVSSNVITSKAPGTSIQFALRIVEALCGASVSHSVAEMIVAKI